MNRFSKLVVCLVIVSLSRCPLPWGHSHAGLQGQQLAQHVRLFHPTCDHPQGWHWHCTWPVVATDEQPASGPMAIPAEASRKFTAEAVRTDASDRAIFDTSLACLSDKPDRNDVSPAHAACQQRTYLLLSMLLI